MRRGWGVRRRIRRIAIVVHLLQVLLLLNIDVARWIRHVGVVQILKIFVRMVATTVAIVVLVFAATVVLFLFGVPILLFGGAFLVFVVVVFVVVAASLKEAG